MSVLSVENVENVEQTAIACYLRTVVAIGNCMAEVCPSVGAMYRDRLLKLPRRLGFNATPQSLEQSRDAVETDLLEFSRTATAWTRAGSDHAATLLGHLRETEETLVQSADLQSAFLDDLAEHIRTSAEVDEESQLRTAFKRYAAGLQAYARRARTEKLAAIEDLRRRREEIETWLSTATTSTFLDHETGLLNRAAAEMRIETEITKGQPFCVIAVVRNPSDDDAMKDLGDRLAATIRPYDMIFRWSQDRLVTIFEAASADIAARIQQIGGWLGDVHVEGAHTSVFVLEHADEETASHLIARVESASRPELTAR
jgi:GGDEF domain-containing protein